MHQSKPTSIEVAWKNKNMKQSKKVSNKSLTVLRMSTRHIGTVECLKPLRYFTPHYTIQNTQFHKDHIKKREDVLNRSSPNANLWTSKSNFHLICKRESNNCKQQLQVLVAELDQEKNRSSVPDKDHNSLKCLNSNQHA